MRVAFTLRVRKRTREGEREGNLAYLKMKSNGTSNRCSRPVLYSKDSKAKADRFKICPPREDLLGKRRRGQRSILMRERSNI